MVLNGKGKCGKIKENSNNRIEKKKEMHQPWKVGYRTITLSTSISSAKNNTPSWVMPKYSGYNFVRLFFPDKLKCCFPSITNICILTITISISWFKKIKIKNKKHGSTVDSEK